MSAVVKYCLCVLVLAVCSSCREHIADQPLGNQPPKTFLWLFPDSTLNTGVSRQHLRWWGEDPDGLVSGYLFAYGLVTTNITSAPVPDTLRYTWMTRRDTVLLFPLDTLFRKFVVAVRSVDNTFAGLPDGSTVRLTPFAYWDRNANGLFDAGDAPLSGLTGALDLRGAVQTFPIRNSPPSVSFLANPNDPTLALRQPDTTFTAATFGLTASDPDGNSTLVSYRIALNDTSGSGTWLTVPLIDSVVTLVVPRARSDAAGATVTADVYGGKFLGRQYLGQLPGMRLDALNRFFVQVKDVAGEYSPAASLPAGSDRWYVKRPRGKLLLVSDYVNSDAAAALATYRTELANVPGGELATIDQLPLAAGLTANDKLAGKYGLMMPPFIDPALINTFLLFDYVFWYTDQFPTLGAAQLTLFPYLQNGGKVLFSTSFLSSIDPRGALRDFAPIDSVSSVDLSPTRPPVPPPVAGDTRIPAGFMVYPDSAHPGGPYPPLQFNAAPANHSIYMRPVYRRSDARYLYHLQPDTRNRYLGMPNVAVADGQGHIIFVGLPLHILNNTTQGAGLAAFFTRVFTREFSPLQRISRRLF